jgi:hypothetical protein
MRETMTELAYRLAGSALEEVRRHDPRAPGNWDVDAWRAFFTKQLQDRTGWSHPEVIRDRLSVLQEERDGARAERDALTKRLSESLAEINHLKTLTSGNNGHKPEELVESQLESVPQGGEGELMAWPEIPHRPPIRFASKLSTGERWRREALSLYLMATRGWSLRLEILTVVGRFAKVSPRSGSLKRIFVNGLSANGLVEGAVLSMNLSKGQTRLAVLRLTEEGKDLCRMLGWEPIESEWERLIRLHDGDRQEAHTAAVQAFAYHARRRSWRAEVLPSVEGTKSQPDALVEKDDERIYVEVELGEDKPAKWRNLAELQGFVAVCAATADKRVRLVADCKLDGLKGMATDIETLIQESGGIVGRLWDERW